MIESIIVGVVTGIVTGVYTGIVVMRLSLFSQYKHLIMQATKEVEFGGSGENGGFIKLDFVSFPNTSNVACHSSFMIYIGHSEVGDSGLNIFKEMMDAKCQYSRGMLTFETIKKLHSKWQDEAMRMTPNYASVLCLKGRQ